LLPNGRAIRAPRFDSDELFYPERFAPLLRSVRPDLGITIVPGIGHIGMTVAPDGK